MMDMYADLYMKTLRYAETLSGERSIAPTADAASLIGYSYPELRAALGDASSFDTVILQKLEDEEYLIGEFVDRVLLCPFCMAYNICFRDACPECGSANIDTIQMTHHFKCGYMGAEQEFMRDGQLICPKCYEPLRYIGKDFERSSEVFSCLKCSWSGSESITMGHCVACDTEVSPEKCSVRDVRSYRISEMGKMAVSMGRLIPRQSRESELLKDQKTGQAELDFTRIGALLALTNEFCKMAREFAIPLTALNFSPDIVTQAGPSATQQLTEAFMAMLMEKFREFLRSTDYAAIVGVNSILVVSPHAGLNQSRDLAEKILLEIARLKFSGPFPRTTLSAGIAVWKPEYADAKALIAAAREARATAADRGGARIEIA